MMGIDVCASSSRARFQAQFEVVPLRHTIHVPLEQSLDLPPRQSRLPRDLLERQRIFDVGFHHRRNCDDAAMHVADLRAQWNVRPLVGIANAFDDQLRRDALRHLRAELDLDQLQHQFERRDAARTRVAVAVDRKQAIRHQHARKLLAQCRPVLPVDRRVMAVQQAGLRQRVATGAKRAQRHAPGGKPAQQGDERRGDGLTHVDAAADEHQVDVGRIAQTRRRRHHQAIAGGDRFAVRRDHQPLIGALARNAIGHAQRLDRIDQRDHGIVRQRQERIACPGCGGAPMHVGCRRSHRNVSRWPDWAGTDEYTAG